MDPTPDKGTEKLRELCRLRSTLESFAVVRLRESPKRAAVFTALRKQMRQLKATARRGGYEDFHNEDMQLHRIAVEAANLPTLVACWNTVSTELDEWILKVKIAHWPSLMALYREHEFLLDAWDSSDPDAAERATHHHLEAGWYRAVMSQETLPPEGSAVDRAASFLSTHYASPIDIRWMAQHVCFVSPSHLTRLFRQQFELPPYMWLRQIRLDRAAELLTTTAHPITAVAQQVGYRNVSHFVRDFRTSQGTTPAKYRQAKSL